VRMVALTVVRMVALTVVLADPVARVLPMAAQGLVQSMVAPTVALADWETAKVWQTAGPLRAQATAEPMAERTAAPVAEGSSGSW
jgi:hypothetical protein